MSEYNITFNTSESENRLSKVIEHLNTIGQQADRLDNRRINLGAKVNQEEVKGLKDELGKLFSRQLDTAAGAFSTHMSNLEKTTTQMSADVKHLTDTLEKNRAQYMKNNGATDKQVKSNEKVVASSKEIQKQLEAEARLQQRLTALKSSAKYTAVRDEPDVFRAGVATNLNLRQARKSVEEELTAHQRALEENAKFDRQRIKEREVAHEKAIVEDRKRTREAANKRMALLHQEAIQENKIFDSRIKEREVAHTKAIVEDRKRTREAANKRMALLHQEAIQENKIFDSRIKEREAAHTKAIVEDRKRTREAANKRMALLHQEAIQENKIFDSRIKEREAAHTKAIVEDRKRTREAANKRMALLHQEAIQENKIFDSRIKEREVAHTKAIVEDRKRTREAANKRMALLHQEAIQENKIFDSRIKEREAAHTKAIVEDRKRTREAANKRMALLHQEAIQENKIFDSRIKEREAAHTKAIVEDRKRTREAANKRMALLHQEAIQENKIFDSRIKEREAAHTKAIVEDRKRTREAANKRMALLHQEAIQENKIFDSRIKEREAAHTKAIVEDRKRTKKAIDQRMALLHQAAIQENKIFDKARKPQLDLQGKREYLKQLSDENSVQAKLIRADQEITNQKARLRGATKGLTKSNKSLTSSIHSGAQATAVWRAGLNAAGTSMGIFTSQTILAASAAYGLVSTFRASVTAGVEFSDVMARVQAVTGSSAETLDWMKEEVRGFAGTTIFTAKEAADALLQLGMAGLSAEESVAAMPATLRLASIGLMSAGEAADLATNVMTQFGLEASQLTAVVDDLATVANNSNTTISQLGNALTYAGPAAQSANVHITELTAAVGTLASAGIKSSRAGTAMRRVIQMLVAPSDKAQKTLAKLGVATQDLQGNVRPLADVLEDLKNAGVDYADAVELVTLRQSQGFLALVNSTDKYKELEQRQKDNTDAAKEFQKTIEDTLGADFKLLVSAAYEKMLQFFDLNEDGFRSIIQYATDLVKAIDVKELNDFLSTAGRSLASIAATMAGIWTISKAVKFGLFIKGLNKELRSTDGMFKTVGKSAAKFSTVLLGITRAHPALMALGVAVAGIGTAFALMEDKTAATARELERVKALAKEINDPKNLIDSEIEGLRDKLSELEEAKKSVEGSDNPEAVEVMDKLTEATSQYTELLRDAEERRRELTRAEKEAQLATLRAQLEANKRASGQDQKAGLQDAIYSTAIARNQAASAGQNAKVAELDKLLAIYAKHLEDMEQSGAQSQAMAEMRLKERARILAEIKKVEAEIAAGGYKGLDDKTLVTAGDAYVAFTEKVEKFRNQKMEASKAVKQHKKALTAANEAIKSYDKSMASANKQLERDYRFKERTVQLEVEMHQLRMSNLAEYQRKEEEALRQRKANFEAYAAESRGEYVGEDGSLTQVDREIKREEDKREEMAKRKEKYPAEEELMKLYERQKKLQEELAALDEENATQRATLGQEEIDLQEEIRQKHLELGDQKVDSLAKYAEGLISEAELTRRAEAARVKYNKALKEAKKLKGSDRSAAIQKAEADYAADMEDAAGTFGEKFAANLMDNLSGIGDDVADAVASGDWSGVRNSLKAALAGSIGQSIGDSVGGSLSDSLSSTLGDAFGDAASDGFGSMLGGALGKAGGSVVGGLASGLVSGDAASDGFGSMLGGALGKAGGSVVGGLASGLVSGIMAGSETKQTGSGFKLDFELGELINAQLTESFEKSSMFGSSSWTEYIDLTLAESDALARSIGNAHREIATSTESLGFSLEYYTGTIEEKNGELSDGVELYSDEFASKAFAAIEKYQLVGETLSETFQRLATIAEQINDSFREVGREFEDVSSEFVVDRTAELKAGYQSQIDKLIATSKSAQAEILENGISLYGEGSWSYSRAANDLADRYGIALKDVRWRMNEYNMEFSEAFAQQVRVSLDHNELASRARNAADEAVQNYRDGLLEPLKQIENIGGDDADNIAAGLFSELSNSFLENYYSAEEQLKIAADNARSDFQDIAGQFDLGFGLDASKYAIREAYDAAAADPQKLSAILAAADALADYYGALESSAVSALSDLRTSIDAEISDLNESYDSQIEAIREAAEAEDELADKRIESAKASVSELNALRGLLASGLKVLQTEAGAENRVFSAQSAISDALDQARSGTLPTAESLENHIASLSDINSDMFETAEDSEFQQSVMANQLKELDQLAEEQLTIEERTLLQLEDQLDHDREWREGQIEQLEARREEEIERFNQQYDVAKQQLDAALGIDDSVKSVSEAISDLSKAIEEMERSGDFSSSGSSSSGSSSSGSSSSGSSSSASSSRSIEDVVRDMYKDTLGLEGDFAGASERVGYWAGRLKSGAVSQSDFASEFKEAAGRLSESNAAKWGTSVEERQSKLKGYSTGGYTGNLPEDQEAGVVHGQEYVLNADATRRIGVDTLNAWNRGGASVPSVESFGSSSGTMAGSIVRDAVEGLRAEMRSALGNIASNTYQTAMTLDSATRGSALATVSEQ